MIDHPRLPRFIVRYIALVVTALLVVSVLAVNKASSERAETVRIAAIQTCRGQNVVRLALTGYFKSQIAQQKHISYRQFFPTISRRKLHHLRLQQIHQLSRIIHDLRPLNCEQVGS